MTIEENLACAETERFSEEQYKLISSVICDFQDLSRCKLISGEYPLSRKDRDFLVENFEYILEVRNLLKYAEEWRDEYEFRAQMLEDDIELLRKGVLVELSYE